MRKILVHLAIVMALAAAPALAQSLFFPARNDFETGFTAAVSLTGAGTRVATGDFNGDDHPDAVVTLEVGAQPFGDPTVQEAIFVYRGDGRGLFEDNPTVLTLPLNSYAGDVVTGEFTGDSNLDFAVAVEDVDGTGVGNNGGLLIFAGNGSFGFTLSSTKIAQAVEPGLTGLAVGNLNGSGGPDLVLLNSASDSFSVYLSPSYTGTVVSAGVCNAPVAAALGNLNAQAQDDLVIACDPISGSDVVQVWVNNGSGSFSKPAGQPAPATLNDPRAVTIADLNKDNFKDVAVANSFLSAAGPDGSLTLLKGDGAAGFTEYTASGVPVGETPRSVSAADVDGDGDLDLLVANWDTQDISVMEANVVGSGTSAQPNYTETFFAAGFQVFDSAWADLNGDNTPDVVAVNANEFTGSLSSYLGGGDDLVQRVIRYTPNATSPDAIVLPNAMAVADWNDDGADGWAVANAFGDTVTIFEATPTAAAPFAPTQTLSFAANDLPFDVLAADVNGDTHMDLLVMLSPDAGDGRVQVYTNNGGGTLASAATVNTGALPWTMLLADFNGDNEDDLAVSNFLDHTVSIFSGGAGAGFTFQTEFVSTGDGALTGCSTAAINDPQDRDCLPTGLAASDFDGDGNVDLAVSNFGDAFSGGTIEIFSGNGAFGFTHELELETPDPLAPTDSINHETLRSGDLDGNGKDDLVAVGLAPDDYISVWLNTSTSGNFVFNDTSQTPFLLKAFDVASPEAPRNALLVDMNGDGNLDLAVSGIASNNVAIMLGAGDGSFEDSALRTQAFGVIKEPNAIGYGDFDGDGLGDLLAAGARSDDAGLIPSGFIRRSDLDGSGRVDGFDLAVLSRLVVTSKGDPDYEFYLDIDMDGEIGVMDLPILALAFGMIF